VVLDGYLDGMVDGYQRQRCGDDHTQPERACDQCDPGWQAEPEHAAAAAAGVSSSSQAVAAAKQPPRQGRVRDRVRYPAPELERPQLPPRRSLN
jgi:hypothetical protein